MVNEMKNNENPIKRFGSKQSPEYQYFANDFQKGRERHWLSIWHQAAPIITDPSVKSVLEFGGGRDVTRAIARSFGVEYKSIDISDRFFPDVQSSIIEYPFTGETCDLVCSFQCLEHNPWEESLELISHMSLFTHNYLYVSVPYSGAWLSFDFSVRLPKFSLSLQKCLSLDGFGGGRINTEELRKRPIERKYAAHWWEVGRRGLSKKQFVNAISGHGLNLLDVRHNKLLPHHLFFLFQKSRV